MTDLSQASQRKRPSRLAIGITVGVVVAVFILTWISALRRPFFDDDWGYLSTVQQPGWWHSSGIWNPGSGLYRPVLYFWFGGLHSVFGLHSFAFHVATLAVVFVVGVLTWRVAVVAGLNRGALVAGAFVLLSSTVAYPISWAAAASSPISVALALGAILVLLGRSITIPRAVVAGLLLTLGLLTREVVIVAPAVVVVVAWARPGGRLGDALLRSLPLWIVDIGYSVLRAASGAGNPSGPYHQQMSSQALNNLGTLIERAFNVFGTQFQQWPVAITGLITLVMAAALMWSLARHQYILLGGLVWFGLGTLPVVFLVNHPPDPYYVDFALPGLALAVGAACELATERFSGKIAVAAGLVVLVALGIAGNAASNREFTSEYGPDITETHRLLAQVDASYPTHPSGAEVIVIRSTQIARDEQEVTAWGNLFRIVFHDSLLRVEIVPWATDKTPPLVRLVKPKNGAELKGTQWFVASAASDFGVIRVRFQIVGPNDVKSNINAATSPFGWLGEWTTTAVPDGTYTVSCQATDSTGLTSVSSGIEVRVAN